MLILSHSFFKSQVSYLYYMLKFVFLLTHFMYQLNNFFHHKIVKTSFKYSQNMISFKEE